MDKWSKDKGEEEESDGWEMTAIAARLLEAQGACRNPEGDGFAFLVFTDLREAKDRDRVFVTFSCIHVISEGRPVRYVHKEPNGDVQALCGGGPHRAEDGRVVHLGTSSIRTRPWRSWPIFPWDGPRNAGSPAAMGSARRPNKKGPRSRNRGPSFAVCLLPSALFKP